MDLPLIRWACAADELLCPHVHRASYSAPDHIEKEVGIAGAPSQPGYTLEDAGERPTIHVLDAFVVVAAVKIMLNFPPSSRGVGAHSKSAAVTVAIHARAWRPPRVVGVRPVMTFGYQPPGEAATQCDNPGDVVGIAARS